MEPMTLSERWMWIQLVWKRFSGVQQRSVVAFSYPFLAAYAWACVKLTAALLLNREREPYDIEDYDPNQVMAVTNAGAYNHPEFGTGYYWDYIQLGRRFTFYCGSDSSL